MATAPLGTLQEFQPDTENIKDYLERVDLYIEANAIPEDRKRAVLLSVVGRATYAVLSDLLAPALPKEKTYAQISEALQNHFEPKRVVIAERFHFHKREQLPGETIAEYEAALRRLATNCKFGAFLEEALRDRFVCGLRNEAIQRRVLSEKDLSHTKAMEMAQGMEAAESNARSLKGKEPPIQQVDAQNPRLAQQPCTRCGRRNHKPTECRFKDATCDVCGKHGHISPVCRSRNRGGPFRGRRQQRRQETKWIANDDSGKDALGQVTATEEFHLFNVGTRSSKPIRLEVTANRKPLTMDIDTGAALSIISEETRKKVFPDEPLHNSSILLKTYTGERIPVVGQLNVRVAYEGQKANLVLLVVAGNGPSLFGRNWMKYIRPNWHKIPSVHSTNRLQSILDKHEGVFEKGLGKIRSHKAIENLAHSCLSCQAVKVAPPSAPLHPWLWSDSPWTRIHVDFAGPFQGRMFFIVVDAHSKWPEVIEMTTTTTAHTLKALRDLFSRYGLPEQLVSDNGPQFDSDEFASFVKRNRIRHIRCAPYHPASNGLAERFVQTFKRAMKASERDGRTYAHRLAEFLLTYRTTPHATTGVPPTTLFLNRQLRTQFDLLRPDVKRRVQKTHHDLRSCSRQFQVGDPVMVKDFRYKNWAPGVVTSRKGPLSCTLKLDDGRVWNRHMDHIRRREFASHTPESRPAQETFVDPNFDFHGSFHEATQRPDVPVGPPQQLNERRYPVRTHHPPVRFDPSAP